MIGIDLIDRVASAAEEIMRDVKHRPGLSHADLRLEVTESKYATAENAGAKSSGDDQRLGLGVRVLAGDRAIAPGYVGLTLGASDVDALPRIMREAVETAWHRASVNAEMKADARGKFGALGDALADTRLSPVEIRRDTIPAVFEHDPRSIELGAMIAFTTDVSRQVAAVDPRLKFNYVSTLTQLARELFVSTEGARIDQTFALTQGMVWLVAVVDGVSHEIYDALGHQRGWEILERGVDEPMIRFPTFVEFPREMAREGIEVAGAPILPSSDGDVVVVTDPHYNTLVSHEIVGHPVELDSALKMETAYAGRSWLMRGLTDHQIGKRIASPFVTAFSDPALPGYGHYA